MYYTFIAIIVAFCLALVGAFSTLALHHTLMERLDEKLIAASDRAAARRHEAADKSTSGGSCRAGRPDDPGLRAKASLSQTPVRCG